MIPMLSKLIKLKRGAHNMLISILSKFIADMGCAFSLAFRLLCLDNKVYSFSSRFPVPVISSVYITIIIFSQSVTIFCEYFANGSDYFIYYLISWYLLFVSLTFLKFSTNFHIYYDCKTNRFGWTWNFGKDLIIGRFEKREGILFFYLLSNRSGWLIAIYKDY